MAGLSGAVFVADDGHEWRVLGVWPLVAGYHEVERVDGTKMSLRRTGDLLRAGMFDITVPSTAKSRARVVHCKRAAHDVYIGRPGPWGNPYSHKPDSAAQHVVETVEQAIELYRDWLRSRVRAGEPGLVEALAELHGKTLGCWCAPGPCHGDVLAEAAAWAYAELNTTREGPA